MEFYTALSLENALSVLTERGSEATLIAGGTDIMPQLGSQQLDTGLLLHIERVAELKGIVFQDKCLRIGALTTHREIATSVLIAEHYPGLADAAAQVGGWQTQSVGTIGGNICNASPAADLMAPLLVHNAQVVLQSETRGKIELPLEKFVTGRRSTLLASDELLTGILLDPPSKNSSDVYLKVGRRGATEIAIIGLALYLDMDNEKQNIVEARIATLCDFSPSGTK